VRYLPLGCRVARSKVCLAMSMPMTLGMDSPLDPFRRDHHCTRPNLVNASSRLWIPFGLFE
ncbi:hypothetical protein, partial [Metapseudomonas otitidis]|uniref:hypothetical protein n=1 Tax=Metapseudomonas otitidis TaxID=319939 RepID=UPI001ABFDE6B